MTTAQNRQQIASDPAAGLLALDDLPYACDIGEALELMRERHLAQLWVCGALHIARDAAALDRARRAGWDIRISPPRGDALPDPEQPAAHDDWLIAYRTGEYTPAGYSLIFPALDPRKIWWERDERGNPVAPPSDAQTLRKALTAYARALGLPYYRTPQTTGGRLLRSLHSGPHALALETPADMPPPAQKDNGSLLQDVPLMWRRAAAPEEVDAAPYLLTFDVNAQFLRAANGLPLGFGDVSHLQGPMAAGFVRAAYLSDKPSEGKRLIAPGYYRVSMDGRASITRLPMPHPLYRAGFVDRPFSAEGCWVSAPTLRLLVELRLQVATHEAYVWREHHRFFDPWYKRLNEARRSLMADTTPASALALAAMKQTYSHFFGSLADTRKGDKDGLFRPDWRHADIAEARALHYRNMLAAVDHGAWPVLVTEDTLGYLCQTDDFAAEAEARGLRFSDTTGHYKRKDRVDLRQRADVRAALLDPAGDAKDMQMLLSQVRRELRGDA